MSDSSILATVQGVIRDAEIDIPIKYVGLIQPVPEDQKYIELVWLPFNANLYWGQSSNDTGAFRIILHWPNDGLGAYAPMEFVETNILPLFPRGHLRDGVQIQNLPNFSGPLDMGHETLYPWTIRYQRFNRG